MRLILESRQSLFDPYNPRPQRSSSPALNCAASEAANITVVGVDPVCTVTAGRACAPSAEELRPRLERAGSCAASPWPVPSSTWSSLEIRGPPGPPASREPVRVLYPGSPVMTGDVLLPGLRMKPWIHPKSIHGGGGASRLKPPCSAGSKRTGVCSVRFTGAKYARTRRATGAGAETNSPPFILLAPGSCKPLLWPTG